MPCCHRWSWARPPPPSGPQSSHQEPRGWDGHQAPSKTALLGQQSKGPLRTNKSEVYLHSMFTVLLGESQMELVNPCSPLRAAHSALPPAGTGQTLGQQSPVGRGLALS